MREGAYSDTSGASTARRTDNRRLEQTSTPGIYKRGNRYVVIWRDTARRQRKRYAKTLAEARTVKAALTADVARGEYVEESRISFADYAASWATSYEGRTARGVRPGTLADYRRALGLDDGCRPAKGTKLRGGSAIEFFGHTPLALIRPQDLKRYAQHLANAGLARNTIRLRLAPVKAMLATAFEEGVTRGNAAAGVRLGRTVANAPVKTTHALNENELRKVLAEIPERHRVLGEFLAQTGCRISEVLPLRKSDIDFGTRRVMISRRLYDGVIGAPKSRHSSRDVSLSPELARKLWASLAREEDDALVFPGPNGEPYDRSYLYRIVHEAGVRAGIEWPVGLHTFRHSAATILHRRGVEKEAIRRMLGHHSWEFTESVYVHDDEIPDGSVLGDLIASTETTLVEAVAVDA
jgi:integrase